MSKIFALRDSGLSAFLLSEVGVEANGSGLTILSLLARLGKDPWEVAAGWSLNPRDAAIEALAESISRMPPNQQALDDATLTASRLVLLLPVQDASVASGALMPALAASPRAALLVLGYFSLFVALNIFLMAGPKPEAPATPTAPQAVTSTK